MLGAGGQAWQPGGDTCHHCTGWWTWLRHRRSWAPPCSCPDTCSRAAAPLSWHLHGCWRKSALHGPALPAVWQDGWCQKCYNSNKWFLSYTVKTDKPKDGNNWRGMSSKNALPYFLEDTGKNKKTRKMIRSQYIKDRLTERITNMRTKHMTKDKKKISYN